VARVRASFGRRRHRDPSGSTAAGLFLARSTSRRPWAHSTGAQEPPAAWAAIAAELFARGAVLAVGSIAEGNVQGAGYCLAHGLLAPGLETLAESVAFFGDCQTAAEAIGRSVATIAPPRARQTVTVNGV
jgi:hypothetical protein